MALADLVQARIDQLNISQAKAATQCRISATLMHNIVTRNHKVPRPETMQKLSTGLQIPLFQLYSAAGVQFTTAANSAGSPLMRLVGSLLSSAQDMRECGEEVLP